MSFYAVAEPYYDFCDYQMEAIETPCTMITPVLQPCADNVYNITMLNTTKVKTNETLTPFSDGTYYFNFTEDNGDYIITNCDGSSRQIRVKNKEVDFTMLTTIIGLGIMIALFAFLALRADNKHVKYLFLFFAIIEAIILLAVIYADTIDMDVSEIMRANFWGLLGIFVLVLIATLFLRSTDVLTGDAGDPKEQHWHKLW